MKKIKLTIFSMALVMMFVTGCEEESTGPDPYSNGIIITLATSAGSKDYNARNEVSCSKDINNVVRFTAENSDDEVWDIEFQWGPNAVNGDKVFISDYSLNKINLTSTLVGNYFINLSHAKANETFIKVIEFVDGVKIEAEVEGFIYEIGGSGMIDSLKNGYFITTNFVVAKK